MVRGIVSLHELAEILTFAEVSRKSARRAGQCVALRGNYQGDSSHCSAAQSPVLLVIADSISWTGPGSMTSADLVRGSVLQLRAIGGDYSQAQIQCLAKLYPGTVFTTTGIRPVGEAWFFHVRDAAGGTYDDGGPGLVEGLDLETAASGGDCP